MTKPEGKSAKDRDEEMADTELDPFESLFGDEQDPATAEPDGEAAEAGGADGESHSEDPAVAGSPEEPEPEPEPGEGEEEPEPGEGEEEPEPESMEDVEVRNTGLEKENYALRRKLFTLREKDRIREEEHRREELRKIDAEGNDEIDADDIGHWDEGKFVIDQAALDRKIAERNARRASLDKAPETAETYEQVREAVLGEYHEDDRDRAGELVDGLRDAYQWVDTQVLEFCAEAKIQPEQIGGLPRLLELFEETGIRDEFEGLYPDVDLAELVIAPQSPRLMRKSMRRHLRRYEEGSQAARGEGPATEVEGEASETPRVIERPPAKRRPRPMSKRGTKRIGKSKGATLNEVDPADLFEMDDETYKEYERRSAAEFES